jgi:hypothetical protein
MGSAWDGDWNARIERFVRSRNYDTLWNYLCDHPGVPLTQVAQTIGDAAAIQLERLTVTYCQNCKLLGECLLDFLVRGLQDQLPAGWGTKNDYHHASALARSAGFPEPYSSLSRALGAELMRNSPPPAGWLPLSKDDPILRDRYARALERLSPEARAMIAKGEFIKREGSAYAEAIEPIWKRISIYDGPEVFLEQFMAVPTKLGNLFAAHWCQSEVCNGGFHQFFTNSTGVLAPEAVTGFAVIGMPDCSRVVADAMAYFASPYPRDQSSRISKLRPVAGQSRREWDPFTKMDSRFYDRLKNENGGFKRAADVYAQQSA